MDVVHIPFPANSSNSQLAPSMASNLVNVLAGMSKVEITDIMSHSWKGRTEIAQSEVPVKDGLET